MQFGSVQAQAWTEASTEKEIEADLVSKEGNSVTLKLKTGGKFTIDLSRLSPEDQTFVRQQSQVTPLAGNPPSIVKSPDRFEDVPALKAETIPIRGTDDKIFAELDAAILQYMVEKGAPAITMAVSRNGKILYARAFGWADSDLTIPQEPGIRMRIASMTKPVVKAAILNLIADNKLRAEDKVFDVLNLGQYPEAEKGDPRFKEITIQQLMNHSGGWDTKTSGGIGNRTVAITKMFNITIDQMGPMHLIRFALSQPLNFTPGEKSSYSSFGGSILGVTSVSTQRADGISFAAIVNRRGAKAGWNAALLEKIRSVIHRLSID